MSILCSQLVAQSLGGKKLNAASNSYFLFKAKKKKFKLEQAVRFTRVSTEVSWTWNPRRSPIWTTVCLFAAFLKIQWAVIAGRSETSRFAPEESSSKNINPPNHFLCKHGNVIKYDWHHCFNQLRANSFSQLVCWEVWLSNTEIKGVMEWIFNRSEQQRHNLGWHLYFKTLY